MQKNMCVRDSRWCMITRVCVCVRVCVDGYLVSLCQFRLIPRTDWHRHHVCPSWWRNGEAPTVPDWILRIFLHAVRTIRRLLVLTDCLFIAENNKEKRYIYCTWSNWQLVGICNSLVKDCLRIFQHHSVNFSQGSLLVAINLVLQCSQVISITKETGLLSRGSTENTGTTFINYDRHVVKPSHGTTGTTVFSMRQGNCCKPLPK